jgi:hypothetical protein
MLNPVVVLPQPDSPTAPGFRFPETEGDVVHGVHHGRPPAQEPRRTGKCFTRFRTVSSSGMDSPLQQATRWPGRTSSSGGAWTRQIIDRLRAAGLEVAARRKGRHAGHNPLISVKLSISKEASVRGMEVSSPRV